ncbi:MAG: Ktr system potassium uptake protein [Actinomycetota bacterium]|jgi:potassium uptake TrkH family protein
MAKKSKVVQQKRGLHPAQLISLGYLAAVIVGTILLLLPISKKGEGGATFIDALFTTVSAVCVTGLSTVDVANYWTPLGHLFIVGLIAIGGFGIMTFATLVGVLFADKISLRSRLNTASEARLGGLSNVRSVLRKIFTVVFLVESSVALFIAVHLMLAKGYSIGDALWHGFFHAISAFNNAGFALYSDSLISFDDDPFVLMPINFAIILGGLGFPVIFEMGRRVVSAIKERKFRYVHFAHHWSLHTRIVVWATAVLIFGGWVYLGAIEWNNPGTLGPMSLGEKLLNSFTLSIMPRTAGFNSVDIAALHPSSLLGMDVMMFIGAGSAGTGGGIKVTTAAVLIFIVWAEIRGETAVNVGQRRLPRSIQREALTIISLAFTAVIVATIIIRLITDFTLDQVIFEVISAFATVGLSTGITAALGVPSQVILIILMFLGRIGPMAIAIALAKKQSTKHYEYAQERPIIG